MDHGAACDESELTFRLDDPDRRLAGVRLQQRIGLARDEFTYDAREGAWTLTADRPAAWRLEYLLELRRPDGGTDVVCDPGNPRRVGGAFGDKSVVECPGYAAPAWLRAPAAIGRWRDLTVKAPPLDADIHVQVWSPPDPTDRVLVANDGPEFDKLAALGRFSATHEIPHHLVLLQPGDRDTWYAANDAYADALVRYVLPTLGFQRAVGLGASLGGLAMLHAQRRHPGAFTGLFLQSGSFFLPRFDPQERGYRRYRQIIRFVGEAIRTPGRPVPTVITCGLVEENLHNNRHMACALQLQGYPVTLAEVPDGHNFTAWRDALHPHLTELLRKVWTEDA